MLPSGHGPRLQQHLWRRELVRTKKAQPVGSLTQMATIRLESAPTAVPRIKDLVKLASWMTSVFGGWDIFRTVPTSRRKGRRAGPAPPGDGENISFQNQAHARALTGELRENAGWKARQEGQEQIRNRPANQGRHRKIQNKHDVHAWSCCGAARTEIFPHAGRRAHHPEKFEEGHEGKSPSIAPSMLYAWAAITSGIAYGNGAPNLSVDISALRRSRKSTTCRLPEKTSRPADAHQDRLAPALQARMLGLNGGFPPTFSATATAKSSRSRLVQDQGRIEARRLNSSSSRISI